MKATSPYLNFAGNTEEAFNFYKSVFGGEFLGVTRYGDFEDNAMGVPEDQLDKIEMPLQKTEWAEIFGVCIDRFRVQWMVMYTGNVKFSA